MTLTELRAALHAALVAGLGDVLEPELVHAYVPDELATPCVWIDSPIELVTVDVAELVATASVLIVVDGAEREALEALDVLEGEAWVALETVGYCSQALAVVLEALGPTLHAVRLTVDTRIATRTLCQPALATAP